MRINISLLRFALSAAFLPVPAREIKPQTTVPDVPYFGMIPPKMNAGGFSEADTEPDKTY